MSGFNLSEWASGIARSSSSSCSCSLSRASARTCAWGGSEDPAFTIRTMVVQANWPGATIQDTLQQVTERLERKLQETPNLDYLRSYTLRGPEHGLRQPERLDPG